MTVTLFISFMWGMLLSLFVLKPLFSAHVKLLFSPTYSHDAAYKKDLQMISILFAKIIEGSCTDEKINGMSEKEAYSQLYDICEKLEDLGVSWKQGLTLNKFQNKESGASSLNFTLALVVSFSVLLFSLQYSHKIHAQESNSIKEPSRVIIPPPFILPKAGYWLPSVNQFILIPEKASVHVYYEGIFSNSFHAKSAKILIPLPKNIANLSIRAKEMATLDNAQQLNNDTLVLNTPLEETLNQIQAEFTLPAKSGSVAWKKNSLDTLPGVTIFILPEANGVLRNLFSYFNSSVNIEPARIINFPHDFKSMLGEDVLKTDPNSNLPSHELSRQYVRVGDFNSLFPEFNIVGIVPSRFFIYLLVLFFCCFFAAALSISFFKLRS